MLWIAIVANLIAIAIIPFWGPSPTRSAASRSSSPAPSARRSWRWPTWPRSPRRTASSSGRSAAPARRHGLQHDQRGVAVDLRGVLPDQRAAVRHGDRHPVRVRSGRFHADHRRRARRRRSDGWRQVADLRRRRLRHLGRRGCHRSDAAPTGPDRRARPEGPRRVPPGQRSPLAHQTQLGRSATECPLAPRRAAT